MKFNLKKISLLMSLISFGFIQNSNVLGSEFLICFSGEGREFASRKYARCCECGENLSTRCLQFCCEKNDVNRQSNFGFESRDCAAKNYGSGCEHKKDKIFERMKKDGYFCFIEPEKLESYSELYSSSKEQMIRTIAQDSCAYCAYCAKKSIKKNFEFSVQKILKTVKVNDIKCSICLTENREGDTLRFCKNGHLFHKFCIDRWINEKNNRVCPICKSCDILFAEFGIESGSLQLHGDTVHYTCKNIDGKFEEDFDLKL